LEIGNKIITMVRGAEPLYSANPKSELDVAVEVIEAGLFIVIETNIGMHLLHSIFTLKI
jgi:hypothetical protein